MPKFVYSRKCCYKAKIIKLFASRTRPTVRKRCDSKHFLHDLRRLFFCFFWLPEIVTGSSDIVPEFTFGTGLLLNEQNLLPDF